VTNPSFQANQAAQRAAQLAAAQASRNAQQAAQRATQANFRNASANQYLRGRSRRPIGLFGFLGRVVGFAFFLIVLAIVATIFLAVLKQTGSSSIPGS